MRAERRKHRRIAVSQHVALVGADGSPIAVAMLRDISVGGARIRFEQRSEVPAAFMLQVPRGGKVQRPCQVVWQSEAEMGVQFVRGISATGGKASEVGPSDVALL